MAASCGCRVSMKRLISSGNALSHRFLREFHSARPNRYINIGLNVKCTGGTQLFLSEWRSRSVFLLNGATQRLNSSYTATDQPPTLIDVTTSYVSEPLSSVPTVDSPIGESVGELLSEATFVSQGLGGWTPVGILQSAMEYVHVGLDVPWWLTIVLGTVLVKSLMFPLTVYGQRNSTKMNNNMPQMQVIQMKLSEARKNGDALLASKYSFELMNFMKEKEMNPIKGMLVPMAQAPVFISFFLSLRGMANLPIDSMKMGGLYWFTNLTIPDPFYILPIITSATLFLTLELGIEGGIRADSMKLMKYFLRAMPIVILPFTINFPAAVLCYWVTSNFFSLVQVAFLRQPAVRRFFNIEQLVRHPSNKTPLTSMSFSNSVKDTWTNAKIAREMEDRHRVDEIRFRKAGHGPIQKTFTYDPTKQNPTTVDEKSKTVINAKSSDK